MQCVEKTLNWNYTVYIARFYAFDMIESLGPAGTIAVLERLCEHFSVRASSKKPLQSPIKIARAAL